MPADCRGWAHHVTGWAGSVSLDDGVDTVTVAPSTVRSALDIWQALADAAEAQWPAETWTWGLSDSGGYLTMTNSASRTLSFSGGLDALLGFPGGASGTAFTATSYAVGLVGDDAVLYTDDVRQPSRDGLLGYGRVNRHETPGTWSRTPRVQALVAAEMLVQWTEDAEQWRYPGRIDIYTAPTTLTTADVQRTSIRAVGRLGHHRITVDGVRA